MRLTITMTFAALALSACDFRPESLFNSQTGAGAAPVAAAAPAPLAPPPITGAPADRLIAAIEAEGCLLSSANVSSVLTRANLSQDDLLRLAPQLAADGRAEVSGSGSIRVLTAACI